MRDVNTKVVSVQNLNVEIKIKSYNANVKFLFCHFLFNFSILKITIHERIRNHLTRPKKC